MPVTPRFEVLQTSSQVELRVRTPYVRIKGFELVLEDDTIHFHCAPYLLRLVLPGRIVADEEKARVQFDADLDHGTFFIHIDKVTVGEVFPDLDLLTMMSGGGSGSSKSGGIGIGHSVDMSHSTGGTEKADEIVYIQKRKTSGAEESDYDEEDATDRSGLDSTGLLASFNSLGVKGSTSALSGLSGLMSKGAPFSKTLQKTAGAGGGQPPLIEVIDSVDFVTEEGGGGESLEIQRKKLSSLIESSNTSSSAKLSSSRTSLVSTSIDAHTSLEVGSTHQAAPASATSHPDASSSSSICNISNSSISASNSSSNSSITLGDASGELMLCTSSSSTLGRYGFNRAYGPKMFQDLREEILPSMLSIPDPDNTLAAGGSRASLREAYEAEKFDLERFLADSGPEGLLDPLWSEALASTPYWLTMPPQQAAALKASRDAESGGTDGTTTSSVAPTTTTTTTTTTAWTDEEVDALSSLRFKEYLLDGQIFTRKKAAATATVTPAAQGASAFSMTATTEAVFPATTNLSSSETSSSSLSSIRISLNPTESLASSSSSPSSSMLSRVCDELHRPELCRALAGLFSILASYCYDYRLTGGEHNVESGWTISVLSPLLSWLDDEITSHPLASTSTATTADGSVQTEAGESLKRLLGSSTKASPPMKAVASSLLLIPPSGSTSSASLAISGVEDNAVGSEEEEGKGEKGKGREPSPPNTPTSIFQAAVHATLRSIMTYPYLRRWDAGVLACSDALTLMLSDTKVLLRSLLKIRDIFKHDDARYLLNTLWMNDYCTWLQMLPQEYLVEAAQRIQIHLALASPELVAPTWGVSFQSMKDAFASQNDDYEEEEEEEDGED